MLFYKMKLENFILKATESQNFAKVTFSKGFNICVENYTALNKPSGASYLQMSRLNALVFP